MNTKAILLMVGVSLAALSASAQTEAQPDTLSLPGYEELDELVIEATRPVVQSDGAKLTYNVDEDPAASSSNALDILKKVPQLSVDADGNVLLNGSSDFKFQLNGLDNPMLKQYASQIFQGMPANMIVKIEVITEPGAKEDAEGSAGIINIITERTRSQDGYNGSISLRADNRTLTPSLYGLIKKNKFTLSANLNYQWGFGPQRFEQEGTTQYLDPTTAGIMKTTVGQKTRHQYVGGSLNMSWEPNPANLFTAGGELFYIDADIYSLYGTTSMYGPDGGLPLWSYSQDGSGKLKVINASANASYRHNFAESGNYLVLSYLFNFGNSDLGLNRRSFDLNNYDPGYPCQYQRNRTFDRGHTVQADYANDFGSEHHLLEVGAKGIFRHNTALSGYFYGNRPDALDFFPDLADNILQPQNIYAGYASYTGSFGKFGLVAGLRYEHTLMGITDHTDPAKSFRNHLNDWVPNAALTWSFSPASNLRLAYQMRISRPSIQQVNPFELSFTPYQINKGNPDLTSEHNHILSLKYSSFGRIFGGSIGVEYDRADNAISSFTYILDREGSNVLVTSYANIGKKQDVALTGFLTWGIIHGMNLSLNGRFAYNSLRSPGMNLSNHGWSGNIGGNWTYAVAEVYKFSAYAAWHSRSLELQGYSTGYYYYGISASRDFLADKSLSLSISANNFLQKTMTFHGHTATPDVIYDNTAKSLQTWNVGVALTWKFGSLNAKVKNTGVEVVNDDINQSSNKSQGSSL